MAYLTIRIKDDEGHSRADLSGERMIAGRSSDCDIPIRHNSISRQHCAFVCTDSEWFIEDLGSANGTRVNGERISGTVKLAERDIVKFGAARLTVHLSAKRHAKATPDTDDDGGINLAGANFADAIAETYQRQEHDPEDAIPCGACGAWVSVAHRNPGDRMPCPRCQAELLVPRLVS